MRELHEALRQRDSARKELEAAYQQVEAAYEQLDVLSREINRIHASRLWRLAGLYWRFRRWLGRASPAAGESAAAVDALPPALAAPGALPDRYDVLCFPIIDWDFRFQRPQQLMSLYGRRGHRVFYVAQKFRASGPPHVVEEKAPGVYEVSLRGRARNVYADSLDEEAAGQLLENLDALRKDLSLGATAAIVQLPFWWPLARRARERFGWPVVYDCMDHHAGFSTNRDEMLRQEEELLRSADAVTASSEFIRSRAAALNPRVTLVPNGCDYEFFAAAGWRKSARPVVGYYGAIADWFDGDLLADVAQGHPEWDFLLVGSTYSGDTRRLARLANVSLPGEKPYREIPSWLGRFDVAVIPFKRIPLTEATNPVKAYEILAAGKPLVAVPLPEIAAMAPHVRLAATAEEFGAEISAALGETSPELVEARRAFARENTWQARFDLLDEAVRSTFPRVSIVIVTYGNRALSLRCLRSVFDVTEWPAYEVIVVDNASHDGTVEALRELALSRPDLTVLENSENAGFAAANNRGLAAARGEIVVMLNNDTVVTHGWLTPLVRRLRSEPALGLVGPSTNEIGNDAKVPVGYDSAASMPAWAADFVRRNDGVSLELPVLAMFCVAMRREVFEEIGPLDERFGIGMFEDDDYSRRVLDAGYRLLCVRDSFVHHEGGASFKRLPRPEYRGLFERNRMLYEAKWGSSWVPHDDGNAREKIPLMVVRLRDILRRSARSLPPIVFLSDDRARGGLPLRARSLARALGREGRLVFFDCTASEADSFAGFVEAGPNLWLYKGPRAVLDRVEEPVVWVAPRRGREADRWKEKFLVYDLEDDPLLTAPEPDTLLEIHARLLRQADLVLCADRELAGALRDLPRPARHLANAAAPAALGVRATLAARPTALTWFAEESRFDAGLLAAVASRRPGWNFLVLADRPLRGGMADGLRSRPNVSVNVGTDEEELYAILGTAHAVLLPLVPRPPGLSPAAFYDALAAGVPVVATPMDACAVFDGTVIAADAAGLAAGLDEAGTRATSTAFRSRARAFAAENTWSARAAQALREIAESREIRGATARRRAE